MEQKHTITDNSAEQRYEMIIDNDMAIAEYTKSEGIIILSHVYVPPKFEGQGIGSALVRAVLEDIKAQGLQLVPQCPFVAQWIYRHPQWEELVLKEVVK